MALLMSFGPQEAAVSLAVGVNYLANAAIIYITPLLMEWSKSGTLLFFGILNMLHLRPHLTLAVASKEQRKHQKAAQLWGCWIGA
eukprot:g2602.t1